MNPHQHPAAARPREAADPTDRRRRPARPRAEARGPRRIVIDARSISSSTGTYMLNLVRQLELLDRENEYIVLVPTRDRDYWVPTNPNWRIETCDVPDYSFAEQTVLLHQLRRLAPDLVHFTMPQQPVLHRGPSITTVHDLTLLRFYNSDKSWLAFHLKQLVGRLVFRVVARTSDRVLVPSARTAADLERLVPMRRPPVVTYEAATSPASPARAGRTEDKSEYLLYVGTCSDYKNLHRAVQAFDEVRRTRPGLRFVLAGADSTARRSLLAWAADRGIAGIETPGWVDDAALTALYRGARAYVFPSLSEGFGLPGLEAMAHGLPVISSDATCLPEIYGDAARYFDPMSVDSIAAAMAEVLSDDNLRATLRARGAAQVARFSWRDMAERTLTAYSEVLASAPRAVSVESGR